MLQRGLSRITESETYDLVGNVTSVEAGAPVAGIFNNAKLKLEAAVNNSVNTTLENWQFLGFAFNKYCKPSDTKFHNLTVKAEAEDTYSVIVVPADAFDSTTTGLTLYSNAADGKTAISTAVTDKASVDAATKYFLDANSNKIYLYGDLAGLDITVQYHTALNAYAAQLQNQFGPNIFTSLEQKVTVITSAQTIAIDSKFVNASGYVASGVYNKDPSCYLNVDSDGNFIITVGGSSGVQLKNLLFLGFEGDAAVFKLTPNSNLG